MRFRVSLDIFRGPLDLLLHLVRKHELDPADIPIAEVTDQFLAHLDVIEKIDVNAVGDFLDMASTLIEIKSREALPQVEEETEEIEDPRQELVERLLEYKRYKDAASMLEDRARAWQRRFPRVAHDVPETKVDPASQPLQEVGLWDLVSAFGRILRESMSVQPAHIKYDDTPIETYMRRIHERLAAHGKMAFSEMFQAGMHKSALVGVFLAILELVRHGQVSAEQNDLHGEIVVRPGEGFATKLADVVASDYSRTNP